jgi:S-formylglutathione hydrolase FrmB
MDKPGVLIVDGYKRSYTIHIPAHVGRRAPVVFMLHGMGATTEQAAAEFGWRDLADRENFIAVFPQALPIFPTLRPAVLLPQLFLFGSVRATTRFGGLLTLYGTCRCCITQTMGSS